MKIIIRETDYALRALSYMAIDYSRPVTVHELRKKLIIPKPFLRKLMQIMAKAKLLKSTKGKGGGFKLRKKPKEIKIIKVIQTFQGPYNINKCLFKKRLCPNRFKCLLRKKINKIEKNIIKEFKSLTLKQLMSKR